MLSTEDGSGKTYLANRLKAYWEGIGLHVRMLSDGTDFDSNSSKYALANTITDLYIPQEEDILIIEQPSLNRANIPVSILQDAQLNLVIASADHGWKDIDKMLLQKLKAQLGKAPYLYLNWAPKYEVETYTGMLPPYTFLHKQLYRLSQLALTESFIRWKKNSRKNYQDDDNEEEIYNRDPHQSSRSFYVLFALQFLPILASIFIEVKLGIATLAIIVPMTFITLIACSNRQTDWSHSRNIILLLFFIWGIYCLLEISNPNNVQEAWNISIGHYLFIPIICAVLVPISIRDRKGIESLLFIWGIFILIVTIKGYWQKNHGFTDKELYFLYTLGGARTHIIWSGIRYFSCFSDAANYGVHSAMAASAFGIAMFYVQKRWMKVFFAFIMICGIYGIGISGTRAAVAVPIGAILMYVLISKNTKSIITSSVILIGVFSFFYFTNIGNGNQYIRKMRSAFRPTEDASYQVRVENRKKMKVLMDERPMGYGLGLSKGGRFNPKEQMPYPPDSWLVSVWVESGIIGLTLYLLIHGALFAWCSWILMFKIMNQRLRGLLAAWLCTNAGFFIAAYANDVMIYPNPFIIYTGFALCITATNIDPVMQKEDDEMNREKKEIDY